MLWKLTSELWSMWNPQMNVIYKQKRILPFPVIARPWNFSNKPGFLVGCYLSRSVLFWESWCVFYYYVSLTHGPGEDRIGRSNYISQKYGIKISQFISLHLNGGPQIFVIHYTLKGEGEKACFWPNRYFLCLGKVLQRYSKPTVTDCLEV
jgi:hypothetical protein